MKFLSKTQIILASLIVFSFVSVFWYGVMVNNNLRQNLPSSEAVTSNTSDINGDGAIDIYDLSILLSNWNMSGTNADVNNDGTVNIFDLSTLLSRWGTVGVTPMQFGAVGDGVTDDTAALQNALNSLTTGKTLLIPAGKIFRHTNVITINKSGVFITGTGTLLATNEQNSEFFINADNVTVDGPTFKMASTTKRWDAYEQMKVRIGPKNGITVKNTTIDGSAAAGMYIGGASNFTVDTVTVKNSRADAFHMTSGSNNGLIKNVRAENPGDDGVAVVSYLDNATACHDIIIDSPILDRQVWGRGFSVVGGYNITYKNVYAYRSAAAAVYVSAEGQYNTYGVDNIIVDGGELVESNQQANRTAANRPSPTEGIVEHGAVILYNSNPGQAITNVTVKNLTITNTLAQAYAQVRMVAPTGGIENHVSFENITINGGDSFILKVDDVPASSYRSVNWRYNGVLQPDHIGW